MEITKLYFLPALKNIHFKLKKNKVTIWSQMLVLF